MSDTPRTDAFFDLLRRYEYAASQEEQKLIDLCRTLERSLATREAELRERDARIAELQENGQRLVEAHNEWKREALDARDRVAALEKALRLLCAAHVEVCPSKESCATLIVARAALATEKST